jgi:hypothetical protein
MPLLGSRPAPVCEEKRHGADAKARALQLPPAHKDRYVRRFIFIFVQEFSN